MGWLDALERRARQAVGVVPAAPAPARQPAKPQPTPVIKTVWMQTAPARSPDYPGAAEPGFYSVTDGVLTMHDESGKPTGQRQQLGPADDPHRIAGRLRLEAWRKATGESNFNRRLDYRPFGIV
jgi:hypothetical protein